MVRVNHDLRAKAPVGIFVCPPGLSGPFLADAGTKVADDFSHGLVANFQEVLLKRQSGFTLIELLLVLAIIGIISAIAIPALLNQRQKAKAKATQSMVANVASEVVRINDDLRANAAAGVIPGTASVLAAIALVPNYQYPAVKNPYGGIVTPYIFSGAATNPGEVGLVGSDAYVDPATGNVAHAVTINGVYINDSGTTVSATKVVALD